MRAVGKIQRSAANVGPKLTGGFMRQVKVGLVMMRESSVPKTTFLCCWLTVERRLSRHIEESIPLPRGTGVPTLQALALKRSLEGVAPKFAKC